VWGHGVALTQGLYEGMGEKDKVLVSEIFRNKSIKKKRVKRSAFCFAFSDNL
jgi:hypothetical protein